MSNKSLAHWIKSGLDLLNLMSKLALLGFFAFGLFSIFATFMDGKIGQVKMFSEWRVLTPMLLSGIAHTLALLLVTHYLGEITKSHIEGDPFVPQNGIRLRKIAIVLALLEIARLGVQFVAATIILALGQPEEGVIAVKFAPNLVSWGAVCIILLLSQIFQEGARLRQNDKLTI